MAIQMRRGLLADFDPTKMKAGEWAVSTDADNTNNQKVYMCFKPGVTKQMVTTEDLEKSIGQYGYFSVSDDGELIITKTDSLDGIATFRITNNERLEVELK